MINHEELRRAVRRSVDLSCEFISSRWDRPVKARALDLTLLGVGIKTSFPLCTGDRVVLSFSRPRLREQFTLFANVKRVSCGSSDYLMSGEVGVGLEFENLSADEQGVLAVALREAALPC